ncbi:SPOR domain-containing protein [Nodosilinea sp. LEGE 07088]|uniref:SPOR domain-containing protein n=1 Tax=Nodosilinea sp. LEGE 07088 TaxID=2777968 RepID=UPI001882D01F|nr:SPOR domain-containing protein [Nodosilinea sp. LEGE 07088]MBE9140493.1 SPOR domain-containing protein [Nodosilinea sp. LEGE 07088]
MTIDDLSRRLADQGCNPALYAIGDRGTASDAFCLTHNGTQWQVYYTERGQDSAPIYASTSESQACQYFFRHIMAMRHDHCVGCFKSRHQAEALHDKLQAFGLSPWRDQIPFGGPSEPRFRVFVSGQAIFLAKAILGTVPIRDQGV